MDVRDGIRSIRRLWLAAGLALGVVAPAHADPIYNAIDLGTGSVTYGVDSSGDGTVTGSNGLTYAFNPSQNDLPAQWSTTSRGVPIVASPPTGSQDTYGDPDNAYSFSHLISMNSQGLAAGIDASGVSGHLGNSEAFLTQQQANGSWGTPIPLWSGSQTLSESTWSGIGILGVAANGQVLGYGVENPSGPDFPVLYLYDTKTRTLTNLSSLINSMTWAGAAQGLPALQGPDWNLSGVLGQIDDQGRILVQATEGATGPVHNLLLVPEGVSSDPIATPEPTTWAIFATLIVGWMARERLRSRRRG